MSDAGDAPGESEALGPTTDPDAATDTGVADTGDGDAATDTGTADSADGDEDAPFRLAIRETDEGTLLAACDADLIGETVAEDGISLTISESFYGEDGADAAAVRAGLDDCAVANLVGREVVDIAIEAGVVDGANVLDIEGTPHAQALWM
ncbi:MAG: DUF424 domain-containing protein [Halococcoides sp.]